MEKEKGRRGYSEGKNSRKIQDTNVMEEEGGGCILVDSARQAIGSWR